MRPAARLWKVVMPDEMLAPVALGALVVALLSLLLVFGLALRLRGLTRRTGIQADPSGTRLDGLAAQREQIDTLTAQQRDLADRLRQVDTEVLRAVTRVGVVRFNPFDDTGGNQSFALALLDGRSDGIVLSSLHSRQQTRVYLKAIQAGAAESALSAEEAEALRQAIGG